MSSRPSLLWVNQFAVLPRDGGGTRHFELGRELVKRGWQVTLFASDFHMHRRTFTRRANPADVTPVAESAEGVEIRWLWASPYESNDWRRARNWLSFAGSVRAGVAGIVKPDVVIGSSPQLFAARAGWQAARTLGVPFVFEVRDLWPEGLLAGGGRRGVAYHVMDVVATRLYRRAARIIVLAHGVGEHLVGKGVAREKIVHVPNGVDVELMTPPAQPRERGATFTAIYAGAHGMMNGLDAVLDAAERLGPDSGVRFRLVGDGPEKPALREAARARGLAGVEFLDAVPKAELAAMLASADAGLMVLREAPLFTFGVSPNKLFDYTAAALPVICNVPGEVAHMVAEAGAGIQTRDSTGAALADAVRALQATPEAERVRMGRAGRQWVEREHSRPVLGDRLDRALRTLIAR